MAAVYPALEDWRIECWTGVIRFKDCSMRSVLPLTLCLVLIGAAAMVTTAIAAAPTPIENRRKQELRERLCAAKELNCAYVAEVFADPRLQIYYPPKPEEHEARPKERERNPFLTTRFGLLTTESLDRCREFLLAHSRAFDAASKIYGVPPEIICGILRIETDFGIPTKLAPNPLGRIPAINRLVTMYVRCPASETSPRHFARRQAFALYELKSLLQVAHRFGWDLFQIPGSPTGAIGLAQFEPSSFNVAVDGNGDGKIDLFDPEDAIVSVASYLVSRGWDSAPLHQQRAVYAYYGGSYDADPNKYYMRAVLRYAADVRAYLDNHPTERQTASTPEPFQFR